MFQVYVTSGIELCQNFHLRAEMLREPSVFDNPAAPTFQKKTEHVKKEIVESVPKGKKSEFKSIYGGKKTLVKREILSVEEMEEKGLSVNPLGKSINVQDKNVTVEDSVLKAIREEVENNLESQFDEAGHRRYKFKICPKEI